MVFLHKGNFEKAFLDSVGHGNPKQGRDTANPAWRQGCRVGGAAWVGTGNCLQCWH